MTNMNISEAGRLIEDFLSNTSSPQTNDWKRLINQHPEFASEIALAAIDDRSSYVESVGGELNTDEKAIYNRTISRVLNMVHSAPIHAIQDAQIKIEAIKGPSARTIAQEVGLGQHVVLLNRVLSGRTRAPGKLLADISKRLDIAVIALEQFFELAFANNKVPAYKATGAKPQVAAHPQSWADAVRELKMSKEDTTELLKLEDEAKR